MINKVALEQTDSLEEAINKIFGLDMHGRLCILTKESMSGKVAEEYDFLGKNSKQDTYKKIVEDFKQQTNCYGVNHGESNMQVGTILEVGCGSGLLCFELYEQTNGNIIGVDLSKDMIELANKNLNTKSKQRIEEIREFWKHVPEMCKPNSDQYIRLRDNSPFIDRIKFIEGSAYNLTEVCGDVTDLNYVVCRNALHRFQHPEKAISQMYESLRNGGKLYLRDIKRDADWHTVVNRIGDKRWQTESLVEDYLAAMASMLTVNELIDIVKSKGIKNYQIYGGTYLSTSKKMSDNLVEFEKDAEYVCVIKK